MNLPIKTISSSFMESTSKTFIDGQRISKSPQRSPKSRFIASSEEVLRKKPTESLAENKRKFTLNKWKHDRVTLANKMASLSASQQIVLPIQSPTTSRRANMKLLPKDLHFSHQRVLDNNDQPLTSKITIAPEFLGLAYQELKIPSTNKKDASMGIDVNVSTNQNVNNITNRAHIVEGTTQPVFQSTRFSSLCESNIKDGLYNKHAHKQIEKKTKTSTRGCQTAREFPSVFDVIQPGHESNLKLKLKNILARLRPETLKAEFQACHRAEVESCDKIESLIEAPKQQLATSRAYVNQKQNKPKVLEVNLKACDIHEVPFRTKTEIQEHLATLAIKDSQQKSQQIRLPKLNLSACQNFADANINLGKVHEQQASTSITDLHKNNYRANSFDIESVHSWQTSINDVDNSNRLYKHQEWINGVERQPQSMNGHQSPTIDANSKRKINKSSPLKLKLDICKVPIMLELLEEKPTTILEDAKAPTYKLQPFVFSNKKPHGQMLLFEENGVQVSLGRALKQKLADGLLSLNSQAKEKEIVACPICGHVTEDIVHFLIKCVGYQLARDILFQKIAKLVPSNLFEEFSMLKSAAKASALVGNVFWGVYSNEVDVFLRSFLENIWKVRDCISKLISKGLCGNPIDHAMTSRTPCINRGILKSTATNLEICSAPQILLKKYGQRLTKFEQQEILQYANIYFLGLESQKIQASNLPGENNYGYDDERGDYIAKEHDQVAYRYEVLGILGKGSFGQVLKCNDHKHKALQAVKIIRNKRSFHQQAMVEVKILQHLRDKALDEPIDTNTINIYESFQFRGHLCITFSLHDISLYEFIKRNNFQGMNMSLIRSFAIQMLESLQFLRKLQVIHSDLKPENILLQQPKSKKIVIIDFGSSCFAHEKIYTYIQSRFYRSPEVILGVPYDTMIDIWSFGCVIAELFSGHPLFPGENEVEQLSCIMEVLDLPPPSILEDSLRKSLFFDAENHPKFVQNSRGKKRFPGSKDLGFAVGSNDGLFISFIESCLRWDKNKRLTPKELMQHPWMVANASSPIMAMLSPRLSSLDNARRAQLQDPQASFS